MYIYKHTDDCGIFSVQSFRKIRNAMTQSNIVGLEVIWIVRKSHIEHRTIIWLEMWCKTTVLVKGLKWFCNSFSLRITNTYSKKNALNNELNLYQLIKLLNLQNYLRALMETTRLHNISILSYQFPGRGLKYLYSDGHKRTNGSLVTKNG